MRLAAGVLQVTVLFVAVCVGGTAGADANRVTVSTGVNFSTGTYGGDRKIEDLYVPVSVQVDMGNAALRLTVPYLSVDAPEGTIIVGPDGEPLPGEGPMTTNSGLGDVTASVTFYDVLSSPERGVALDLTGKVKFGTADETKGLGTGENDYTVQADLLKFVDRLTLVGSLGYAFRGTPPGAKLDDSMLVSVGGSYKFSDNVRGGLFLDYRESSISGADAIQELSGFVSRRLKGSWRVQVHVLTGFSDNSADWGAGIQLKRAM